MGDGVLGSSDGINGTVDKFRKLLRQAVNSPNGQVAKPITYKLEIEIARVLFVGGETSGTPNVAMVEDTNGEIWMISEGKDIKSRRDVCTGMRLELTIEDNAGLRQGNPMRFRSVTNITILNKEKIEAIEKKCCME